MIASQVLHFFHGKTLYFLIKPNSLSPGKLPCSHQHLLQWLPILCPLIKHLLEWSNTIKGNNYNTSIVELSSTSSCGRMYLFHDDKADNPSRVLDRLIRVKNSWSIVPFSSLTALAQWMSLCTRSIEAILLSTQRAQNTQLICRFSLPEALLCL